MRTCQKCKKTSKELKGFPKNGDLCKNCKRKCIHGSRKYRCKQCKGASRCQHDRIKYQCKDCGGKGICKHNKQKQRCKKCGGSQICEHNRQKSECKDCCGSQMCVHKRRKYGCKNCNGKGICKHNINRSHCVDCMGNQVCNHKKIRSQCKQCKGGSICKHNQIRAHCIKCRGSLWCKHNLRKNMCFKCEGNRLCVNCKFISKNKKYGDGNFCARCFFVLNPNLEVSKKNRQLKQDFINDLYKKLYPKQKWDSFDKIVENTCNRRRPDYFKDFITHILILEIDENQHKRYNKDCERNRINELYTGLADRKIIMIRFNPDKYIDKNQKNVEGCFTHTPNIGNLKFNKKIGENRLKIVQKYVDYYSNFNNIKNKYQNIEVKQIKLFYDGF